MGVKVKIDKRGWDNVRKAIVKTQKRVKVGILTDSTHVSEDENGEASEISMIELAAIHEFGSPAAGIPERSFLRATIDGKRDEVNDNIEKIVGGAVRELLSAEDGKSVSEEDAEAAATKALGRLGLKLVSMIKSTIRNRETVGPEDQENAPSTIARKGSSLPLVDTAQLLNAIVHQVVDKEDADE